MKAALAAAPEPIVDSDCPCDPNEAPVVEAYWKDVIVSQSLSELDQKLEARRRGPNKLPSEEF